MALVMIARGGGGALLLCAGRVVRFCSSLCSRVRFCSVFKLLYMAVYIRDGGARFLRCIYMAVFWGGF